MSDISAAEWKKKLTSILEDLNHEQYGKLLETLDKIPKCQKEKSRENMPQIIMEHYGFDGSVAAIAEAMEEIPRRDPQIQGLLEPFVKKLEAKEGEHWGSHISTSDGNIWHFNHTITRDTEFLALTFLTLWSRLVFIFNLFIIFR